MCTCVATYTTILYTHIVPRLCRYDAVYINLTQKPKWYLEKYPLGKVPCIELEDGEALTESLIIADYLEDAYPEVPLYPSDPLAKAKDKLLIDQFNNVTSALYKVIAAQYSNIFTSLLITSLLNKSFSLIAQLYRGASSEHVMFDEFLAALEVYEHELKKRGTPFFGGSKPSMLDFMIWPWCERLDVLRILRGDDFVLPRERFARLVILMIMHRHTHIARLI